MKIVIPQRLTLTTFENVYSQLHGLTQTDEATLDLHQLEWTEPAGLLPLAASLRSHVLGGGSLIIDPYPKPDKSTYLERMNFYKIIGVKPEGAPRRRHTGEDRFIEITEIGSQSLSEGTKRKLIKLVKGKVGIQGEIGDSFIAACGELVENTKHAYNTVVAPLADKWPNALIHAQFYDTSHTPSLHVCVADCGIGIRRSIGAKNPDWYSSDKEAIDAALVLGMRGSLGAFPGKGMGLAAIRQFMDRDHGRFSIRTGKCLETITPHKKTTKVHYWKGTVVSLEINSRMRVDISDIIKKLERGNRK